MICGNCGREVDNGVKFCKYCGTRMESAPASGASGNQAPSRIPHQAPQRTSKPKKKSKLPWIFIVLLILLLLGGGAAFAVVKLDVLSEIGQEKASSSSERRSRHEKDEEDEEEETDNEDADNEDADDESADEAEKENGSGITGGSEGGNGAPKSISEVIREEETAQTATTVAATEAATETMIVVAESTAEEAVTYASTEASTVAAAENSEFIIPGSDSRYLTENDLAGLTAEQLRIARNELYARHGRKFSDTALQAYFDSCSWYIGTIESSKFSDSMLNAYEIANRDLIVRYEKAHGYN